MVVAISPKKYRAVIFDLDGVITKTASLHAAAWKEMFDIFLKERAERDNTSFTPFDIHHDYNRYVDGKPRTEGIRSFLESRGYQLPQGTPHDGQECYTQYGLGEKKNRIFLKLLEKSGIDIYTSTLELIKKLRKQGIKTALISSSKNCTPIIKKINAFHLFDAKIDGIDAEMRNIKGKPNPDIFLQAAQDLGITPDEAIIVEDAISGVQAGKSGGFATVIGVDRVNQEQALRDSGADFVVKDLDELVIDEDASQIPSAIDHFSDIVQTVGKRKPLFFFDYDGTLSPIVSHPDLAILGDEMSKLLKELSLYTHIAVISGRDRQDVEKRVAIKEIFYAGSHGFDIAGPNQSAFELDTAKELLPLLQKAKEELTSKSKQIPGCWVEGKRYSVAIHFRESPPGYEEEIEAIVNSTLERYRPSLRKAKGKKIFELQPNISWHKGKALYWLLKFLKLEDSRYIPFYFGDDVTDEDAFRALHQRGIGVVIQNTPQASQADYALKDPEEVKEFVKLYLNHLKEG